MIVFLSVFVIFYVFAPDIFSFAFGQEWFDAGIYARILTPYFFLAFITIPLTHLFYILERTGTYLAIQALLLISVLAGLYLGQLWESQPNAIISVLELHDHIFFRRTTTLAAWFCMRCSLWS